MDFARWAVFLHPSGWGFSILGTDIGYMTPVPAIHAEVVRSTSILLLMGEGTERNDLPEVLVLRGDRRVNAGRRIPVQSRIHQLRQYVCCSNESHMPGRRVPPKGVTQPPNFFGHSSRSLTFEPLPSLTPQ